MTSGSRRPILRRLIGPVSLPRAVDASEYEPAAPSLMSLWRAYRLRWKRRRHLLRAWLKRRELRPVSDRTDAIGPHDILVFACIRNEAVRLPYFLDHHRRLGAAHFLVIDNGSDDGGGEFLGKQADVSLWRTDHSYRGSHFGIDWLNHLLARYGHGHWCLTLDADELFLYPRAGEVSLGELTRRLTAAERESYGAILLDLYPQGPLGSQGYEPGQDPLEVLTGFDPDGYRVRVQPRMGNLWIQGGARARAFFADEPDKAPTLNKLPLVRWHWRFAYVNSTHTMLPARLNDRHQDGSGLLLHTKFLPQVVERAAEERTRGEHFGIPSQYAPYYDAITRGPDLWHAVTARFEGWEQAVALGLMSRGSWEEGDREIYK